MAPGSPSNTNTPVDLLVLYQDEFIPSPDVKYAFSWGGDKDGLVSFLRANTVSLG